MKSINKIIALLIITVSIFSSCNKDDDFQGQNKEISLPPKESMDFSFKQLDMTTKSGSEDSTMTTYYTAKGIVDFWRGATWLATSLPTAAFYTSFTQTPEMTDDYTWEWSYSVDDIGATYNARLVGVTDANYETIAWTMYVSKDGIGAYDEFIWFEGTSKTDNSGGSWILNYNQTYPDPFISLDWSASGDEISTVKYTFVREKDENGNAIDYSGSSITYGKQAGELDAYFDVHYWVGVFTQAFVDVNMEWSTDNYNGRIKSEHHFNSTEWNCWDTNGYNADCN